VSGLADRSFDAGSLLPRSFGSSEPAEEPILPYVPLPDFEQRTAFFGQRAFRYDATSDVSICPAGQELQVLPSGGTDQFTQYRAKPGVCHACPLKAKCTTSIHGRKLSRPLAEEAFERVRALHQTEAYKKAMGKRKVWVEPLFAEAKDWHGIRRFRLRERWRVNCEALITASGQNLKRLLKKRGWGRHPWPMEAVCRVLEPDAKHQELHLHGIGLKRKTQLAVASMPSLSLMKGCSHTISLLLVSFGTMAHSEKSSSPNIGLFGLFISFSGVGNSPSSLFVGYWTLWQRGWESQFLAVSPLLEGFSTGSCIMWTWDDQREGQFHIIGVQRRMADWSLEKAQTWEDLLAAHEKWLRDYNFQRHMAHEDRDDGRHSPAQVLNWQRGMQPEPELISRAFSAIGETRVLNKARYAKFRNFLLYGEQGLAGQETLVTIFQETLTLEYGAYPLSKYSVEWQPDDRHLLRVGNPRLYRHPYHTPQLPLWEPGEVEWHVIIRCEPTARRHKRMVHSVVLQLPLSFEQETTA
jgi:Transposase DDE domain